MLRFLTKNPWFYEQLGRLCELAYQASQIACQASRNFRELSDLSARLEDLEAGADELTGQFIRKVDETFVTPMDKEDLETLCLSIDGIIEALRGTVLRMQLYKLSQPHPQMGELADLLVQTVGPLKEMVGCLGDGRSKRSRAIELGKIVHAHEKQADLVFRKAIADLLNQETAQPLTVVKWKEIYECMEEAIDRANFSGLHIDRLVLKYA
ncbi:MAG: DUF47 family protein [Planctomycetes bacterium]|nr:DUF47 family protein [Planctomycetota bacterium]